MNGKKVLVTGSNGMLGKSLLSALLNKNIVGIGHEIDIKNPIELFEKIDSIKPDVIIHTAAFTNVEACEIKSNKAYIVNTLGTQNLVNYCIDKDILFIYISSTGVYGLGKDEAYNEFDDVKPTTIHHKSKYEGEKVVCNHLNKYLILRTGWLYGGETKQNKNFVYKRYLEACSNNIIYSDNSQVGNPTFVLDFVKQIELLIEKKQYGIFNCVNEAHEVSRYNYVKKIIELFEVNCEVKVASKDMYKRVAPVSKNESAINYKLDLLGLNAMGNWEESLSKYVMYLQKGK